MLIEDEFKTIYLNYRIKEIVPFLTRLTPEDKKEIVALLKKHINKEWGHNDISVLAALACCKTSAEYGKLSPGYYSIPVDKVDELFESYIPDWLGENYSFLKEFDYLKILEWEQKGYLKLSDEISASLLSSAWDSDNTSEEILFTWPVTLESHIWLLFQYETEITSNYGKRNWKETLKMLAEDRKIDRSALLRSSLKAVNFNFSKEHNTWFLELFTYLEPTREEILALQDELLMIFHSTQTSLFPGVLKIVNQVLTEKAFKTEDFLQVSSSLITLPTKNIVNALLLALEKIAKVNSAFHENICLLLTPVFLNKDKALQTKAAKIIAKYGNTESEKLQAELKLYTASLLSDAGTLLDKLLIQKEKPGKTEEQNYEAVPWHSSEPVTPIQTIDDFIFFAPQVFSNSETHHFDQFLEALVHFNDELDEDHFNKLEPAFKAALKKKGTGGFQHLLATFFINYGLLKQEKKSTVLLQAKSEFPDLENWCEKKTPLVFQAYHKLLSGIFEMLKQHKKLPLLSVPDHTPCWITANNLVDKLKIYQLQNEQPIPFDLQIAILRVKKENLTKAEQYAKEQLDEKYAELLKPLFKPDYFREKYDSVYLDGSFNREFSYRKIYKWNITEEIPQLLVTISNKKELPENACFLDYIFNSYHGVYHDDLISILYTAPYFSGSVIAKKYNENLSNSDYQYDIKENVNFLDAWMKLNLPFQPVHYLFLSAGLFNKDRTLSGMAFEALINRVVSDDFEVCELGTVIGKKISFGWAPVKRFTDGLSGLINLSTSHNLAFEKLLTAILSAVEKPVFNLKKLLELYYELLNQNQSVTDETVSNLLKEWEKENNLKKIIHQIKTNERKTL